MKKPLIASLIVLILVVGAGVGLYIWHKSQPLIPKTIISQASFAIFYPPDASVIKADRKTLAYDSASQRVIFNASGFNGNSISFSEQAEPSGFVDVPQAYDKLISSLQEYDSFGSTNGTVYLTHPKELNGAQSAVMNAKGTLLFARPSHDLSQDQWRQIFNNLQVAKS